MIAGPDQAKAARALRVMMGMTKLDAAALDKAFAGE